MRDPMAVAPPRRLPLQALASSDRRDSRMRASCCANPARSVCDCSSVRARVRAARQGAVRVEVASMRDR